MKSNHQLALATATFVIGGAALASFLLRTYMKATLKLRAANLIKSMLVNANIIIGRDITVHDDSKSLRFLSECNVSKRVSTTSSGVIVSHLLAMYDSPIPSMPRDAQSRKIKSWNAKFMHIATRIFNYQSQSRAGMVGVYHYDLGNDFFKLWLDQHHMQYSCGCFKGIADRFDLEAAQENKLRMIAQKLNLEPGMKNHGVHVTGITISTEQLKDAQERAVQGGVSHLTTFEYRDYREMKPHEVFDRVVSIAMTEAVGYKNLDEYFSVVARCLKDEGGIAIVHGTAANRSLKAPIELWMPRYIFLNGFIPSIVQTREFAERKLVVEDVHNFGPDYEKMLLCWYVRFQLHVKSGAIQRPQEFVGM